MLILWKVKPIKVKCILLLLLALLSLFNPFRLKQDNMSVNERFTTDNTKVEKVVVKIVPFKQTQDDELAKLRKTNKEIENEIN